MAERQHYNHGLLLESKASTDEDLKSVYDEYLKFLEISASINIVTDDGVRQYTQAFNNYRNSVLYTIEGRKNSGQENIRSSMLEEFFCHLFTDLILETFEEVPDNLFIGKANSFVDLTFSPHSFIDLFVKPNPYVHSKDQDFILGANLLLTVKSGGQEVTNEITIPVLAIECKTYIERNMLDSCSGTARRLKSAMPYCIYIVAAEYMKLKDERPELSDINEVYILCRASVAERLKVRQNEQLPHPIHEDLVLDLFKKVSGHLHSIWWSPEDALSTGKIINRP